MWTLIYSHHVNRIFGFGRRLLFCVILVASTISKGTTFATVAHTASGESQLLFLPLRLQNGQDTLIAPATVGDVSISDIKPNDSESDIVTVQETDWQTTVQDRISQQEYSITWQDHTYLPDVSAAYHAPNRAYNLRTYFTEGGIRVIPRTNTSPNVTSWEWGISLSGYGSTGDIQPVEEPKQLQAAENHFEYHYTVPVTEWYVNDERGLEQGFTLNSPPTTVSAGQELVLEMTLTGDLTPVLADAQILELADATGNHVLRYSNLCVTDAVGHDLPAHFELTNHKLRIVIEAADALYPITVDAAITGLSETADWIVTGMAGDWLGSYVSTAGDVNGDGYSDVIVEAAGYDIGQDNPGAAFLYYGSATGLSTSPSWSTGSDPAESGIYAVSVAGDVNGDGYSDIIVGADYYDISATNTLTEAGRAFVYYGSASGLSSIADWIADGDQAGAHFGNAVGTAGDVNGDGYDDVVIGAVYYEITGTPVLTDAGRVYVYHGSASGLHTAADWIVDSDQSGAWFGQVAGTAGDVNGDGYADIIVGASMYDNGEVNEGRVFAYYGSASGLGCGAGCPVSATAAADWMAESDQVEAWLGWSVSTAGDVNGDGYTDVVVGVESYDAENTNEGAVFGYYGSSAGLHTTADWVVEPTDKLNAAFGYSVGTAGDVNGDGYSDVIVSAPWYDNGEMFEGWTYVYLGSDSGLGTTANWTAQSNQTGWMWDGPRFGSSVGTAGDVNGDGYGDVIIGAPRYYINTTQEDCGRAYLYQGGPSGLSDTVDWVAEGNQDTAWMGMAANTVGDVNGDGYADVLVSAPLYDNGEQDEGMIFVYHGSAHGLSTTADWIAESDQPGMAMGDSMSGAAGDINGDGYDDIIVGAGGYTNGDTNEGAAFVWYGSANGLGDNGTPSNADWMAESNQTNSNFTFGGGTAGDVNGDGYGDIVIAAYNYDNGENNEGAVFVWYGSANGLGNNGTPSNADWRAESNQESFLFGHWARTAGDVNGDGYGDIIVTAHGSNIVGADQCGVFVWYGSVVGLGMYGTPTNANWQFKPNQTGASCYTANTAGDVNGDGYADIIIGVQAYDNSEADEGAAFVFLGSASGLGDNGTPANADWMAESNQAGAILGVAAHTAGDVNGDGYADIVVGAPLYDNGQVDEGRAFVWYGSADGLGPNGTPDNADWSAESDQTGAIFGYRANAAGDVNGDGCADVIIGTNEYENGNTDEGAAFVYYGNDGGLALRPRQLRANSNAPIASLGASDSMTRVRLSLIGRSPLGREQVKLQWQVAPLGTPFTATTDVMTGTSAEWTDTLTTGVAITAEVAGLTPGTSYHWRVRLLYAPGNRLGQTASRWVTIPWNGWEEADFQTADGLVVYYPFNSDTYDESGHGNHGTSYGAIPTEDRFGTPNHAYSFDGVDDYIGQTSPLDLPLGNAPRTIAAWIRSDGPTVDNRYQSIVGYGSTASTGQMFSLERGGQAGSPDDGKLFVLGWDNNFTGNTSLEFGRWYHVAATYDGTTLSLWINGALDGNATRTYSTTLNADGLRVGNAPSNDGWHLNFNGALDDIRIYDRALSEAEILALAYDLRTVTNCNDYNGWGGLGPALKYGGTITFRCSGTIIIPNTIVIAMDTTLDATGQDVTISGNNAVRVFYVNSGVNFTIKELTVVNGRVVGANGANGAAGETGGAGEDAFGGGLYNNGGTVAVIGSSFSNNYVIGGAGGNGGPGENSYWYCCGWDWLGNCNSWCGHSGYAGGSGGDGGHSYGSGICNNGGVITITRSVFFNNAATGGLGGNAGYDGGYGTGSGGDGGTGRGGGLYNSTGSVTVLQTTFANNGIEGGDGGTSTYSNSGVPGGGYGAGIFNSGGTLYMGSSTLSSNTAYGGDARAPGSSQSGGYSYGGGLYSANGTLTLVNNTLSENLCRGGNGVYYGPGGSSYGGGLYNGGSTITALNNTVSHNNTIGGNGYSSGTGYSSGIYNASGTLTLKNTIVAENVNGNCAGSMTSTGYNLDSDNTCGLGATGDLTNTNPLLGTLQDNGGATWTRALLQNSPAIDAGRAICWFYGDPRYDQRGVARPQDNRCDIGAYETHKVQFSVITASVNEYANAAALTVALSGPTPITVTVDYATSDGTATEGTDYTAISGTLSFTPTGSITQMLTIPIIDDVLDEPTETLTLTLSDPDFAVIGSNNPITLAIVDDDNLAGSSKAVSTSYAQPGEWLTYTLVLSNSSNLAITSHITDPLPAGIVILTPTLTGGAIYNELENRVEYSGTLAPYATHPLTFAVEVGNLTGGTQITNIADIDDGTGMHITRTATFTVENVAPVAMDDNYIATMNAQLQIDTPGVLANDSDANGETLTAAILVTDVTHGVLDLHSSGAFTYTPPVDYWGVITFTYYATDGFNNSNIALVTLKVMPMVDGAAQVAPPTRTVTDSASLTLRWVATLDGAEGFLLDVGGTVMDVDNVLTYNTGPLAAGSYTWTVAAYDHGVTSTFAAPWVFAITGAPESTILAGPFTPGVPAGFGSLCGRVTFTDTGILPDSLTITYTYNYPSANYDGLLGQYHIVAEGGSGYEAAVTLCYEDADLLVAGIDPAEELNLHIYRYLSWNQPWEQYSEVNPVANEITAHGVTTFGVFGLGVDGNAPTALKVTHLKTAWTIPLWSILVFAGLVLFLYKGSIRKTRSR